MWKNDSVKTTVEKTASRLARLAHLRGRFLAVLRVQICLMVMLGLSFSTFVVYGGEQLYGPLARSSMQQLLDQLGADTSGRERAVVNGAHINFDVRVVPLPVEQVVAQVEKYCAESSGNIDAALAQFPEAAKAQGKLPNVPADWDPKKLLTLSREVTTPEGAEHEITCLASGDDNKPGLLERGASFLKTGNIGDLGQLRHIRVFAQGESSARVISIWSDESFNIFEMLTSAGDVPGRDLDDVPRPPSSRRLFSGELQSTRHAALVYESALTSDEAARYYDGEMTKHGWKDLGFTLEGAEQVRVYEKAERLAYITANSAKDSADRPVTDVTVVVLGNGPRDLKRDVQP